MDDYLPPDTDIVLEPKNIMSPAEQAKHADNHGITHSTLPRAPRRVRTAASEIHRRHVNKHASGHSHPVKPVVVTKEEQIALSDTHGRVKVKAPTIQNG